MIFMIQEKMQQRKKGLIGLNIFILLVKEVEQVKFTALDLPTKEKWQFGLFQESGAYWACQK